jgi:hypothetical protein
MLGTTARRLQSLERRADGVLAGRGSGGQRLIPTVGVLTDHAASSWDRLGADRSRGTPAGQRPEGERRAMGELLSDLALVVALLVIERLSRRR